MPHVVDEMLHEAESAIAAMRAAALRARALHANAELMRHMRTTAAKLATRPLAEAAALVAGDWMKAWHLDGTAYAEISPPMSVASPRPSCTTRKAPPPPPKRPSATPPPAWKLPWPGTAPRWPTRWPGARNAPMAGGTSSRRARPTCPTGQTARACSARNPARHSGPSAAPRIARHRPRTPHSRARYNHPSPLRHPSPPQACRGVSFRSSPALPGGAPAAAGHYSARCQEHDPSLRDNARADVDYQGCRLPPAHLEL